jgi:ABC-type glycerol-3-phosphate transport system permease component
MVSDALASQVMQGVEEEAQDRGCAVMLGRTGAKSAYIAGYLRTLRTYRAAGVIPISAGVIVTVPLVIMVLILQRRIVEGLTAGASK